MQTLPELRMCWHTGDAITPGFRCGNNDLNSAADWERVIYHAD
jgi:hypothetical protein